MLVIKITSEPIEDNTQLEHQQNDRTNIYYFRWSIHSKYLKF